MNLRSRLVVTLALVTVPLLIGLSSFHYQSRRRVMVSDLALNTLAIAATQTCPLPIPRRQNEHFAVYDAELRAQQRDAPAFPAQLLRKLAEGERAPHSVFHREPYANLGRNEIATRSSPTGAQVLVRLAGSTPACAYLLGESHQAPGTLGALGFVLAELWAPVALTLIVLSMLWVSLSPVVSRLRKLAEAVATSAATGHQHAIGPFGSDEIGDLAVAFEHASAEIRTHVASLEAREQTLREFLANTSHDVMIPLTVMQGALSQEPPDVASARMQAHYIGALVGNLSTAAKLASGAALFQASRVVLDGVVERVVERYRGIASERGISLEAAVPGEALVVAADPTFVEQCLSNLVYNAVRYNRPGGHVTVVLNERQGGFSLRVVDDGPGMADHERQLATRRGFRSQSARRETQGTGLGLNIAQAVVDRHGWTLTLSPSEAGGTRLR